MTSFEDMLKNAREAFEQSQEEYLRQVREQSEQYFRSQYYGQWSAADFMFDRHHLKNILKEKQEIANIMINNYDYNSVMESVKYVKEHVQRRAVATVDELNLILDQLFEVAMQGGLINLPH